MFRLVRSVVPVVSSSSLVQANRLASQRHGSSISVILLENMEKRGERGEVVDVKRGFARNFLIPRKLAAYATQDNRKKYSHLKPSTADVTSAVKPTAADPRLQDYTTTKILSIAKECAETNVLYAALSVSDIKNELAAQGIVAHDVVFEQAVKSIGSHSVTVDGVKINVNVISK